jgi:hypothetical protein
MGCVHTFGLLAEHVLGYAAANSMRMVAHGFASNIMAAQYLDAPRNTEFKGSGVHAPRCYLDGTFGGLAALPTQAKLTGH